MTPWSSAPIALTTASERAGSASVALSSMLRRGAAIARRQYTAAPRGTFPAMEGVTVVDHVLLGRLLSILRDKDTPHRVFRETMTDAALILGYESMRSLRGEAIRVRTPLEEADGVKLAD